MVTEDPVSQVSAAPGSAPTAAVGHVVTLGSAVITLTPGLSSTVGAGPTATYVAISTDEIGQTLITVSSSGTAVTATLTNAPATITKVTSSTLPTTITSARLTSENINPGNAAVPTSSKGVAVDQRRPVNLSLQVALGIAVAGFAAT